MIKVAINGFGRIGKLVFRIMQERGNFDILAVNDITDAHTLAHLLKYDSTHGKYPGTVEEIDGSLVVDGKEINVYSEMDPADLPWEELGIDVVVEATGVFRHRKKIEKHLKAGAKKVVLTVPAKDEIDATVVLGVNDEILSNEDKIVSNASCTTNCFAPIVKVLNENFGIVSGLMTTIHAYTANQNILDGPHKKDLRRARAAAANIVPTSTGAAIATSKVYPDVKGKLDAMAMRVPVQDGSIVDFMCNLEKDVTVEDVNAAMKEASENEMKGILQYATDPLVSSDIIGNPYSSIFDSELTKVISGNFIKVVSWYDNEYGYSARVVDLVERIM
ncbi:MAG: type I glyceraldehyde-3-phosphate dehydrogenase [Candidatus Cloacimonetes bacterium]|nr:type I glyceraldehyde-3-phosphate dehydrogenase [Candidatus Cloacimonadota bacterium]MBS3768497.1 type I glyceraldehyde-3-phosphate dehydrogenase [Candidatus Cloacimonadota bacterium]